LLHGVERYAHALVGLEGGQVGLKLLHRGNCRLRSSQSRHLANCCVQILIALRIKNDRWLRARLGAFDSLDQFGNVGGEPRYLPQLRCKGKDGQRSAWLKLAQVLEHLAAYIHLVGHGCVQSIQQQYVYRAGLRIPGGVGIRVGWEGCRLKVDRSRSGKRAVRLVLFEGSDCLFVSFLEDVKPPPVQVMHGVAVVGDYDIQEDKVGVDSQRGCPGVGSAGRIAGYNSGLPGRSLRCWSGNCLTWAGCDGFGNDQTGKKKAGDRADQMHGLTLRGD
jgi:hypothetical protein